MRILTILIILLSSSFAYSADVLSVYGYKQHVGTKFTRPNTALILYNDGTFEFLTKYTTEESTSIQSGRYSVVGDEIEVEVTDSTCKKEIEYGALGTYTFKYSENSISKGEILSYARKEKSFLRLFDVEKAGCLNSIDK